MRPNPRSCAHVNSLLFSLLDGAACPVQLKKKVEGQPTRPNLWMTQWSFSYHPKRGPGKAAERQEGGLYAKSLGDSISWNRPNPERLPLGKSGYSARARLRLGAEARAWGRGAACVVIDGAGPQRSRQQMHTHTLSMRRAIEATRFVV